MRLVISVRFRPLRCLKGPLTSPPRAGGGGQRGKKHAGHQRNEHIDGRGQLRLSGIHHLAVVGIDRAGDGGLSASAGHRALGGGIRLLRQLGHHHLQSRRDTPDGFRAELFRPAGGDRRGGGPRTLRSDQWRSARGHGHLAHHRLDPRRRQRGCDAGHVRRKPAHSGGRFGRAGCGFHHRRLGSLYHRCHAELPDRRGHSRGRRRFCREKRHGDASRRRDGGGGFGACARGPRRRDERDLLSRRDAALRRRKRRHGHGGRGAHHR